MVPPTLASLTEALTHNYFLVRGGWMPEARMNVPLKSKSDLPERFVGSGVTHLPAEGQIDSMAKNLSLMLADNLSDGPREPETPS